MRIAVLSTFGFVYLVEFELFLGLDLYLFREVCCQNVVFYLIHQLRLRIYTSLQTGANDCGTVDEEALHLAKAAERVHRDMFAAKRQFDNSINKACEAKSVPSALLSLVRMKA